METVGKWTNATLTEMLMVVVSAIVVYCIILVYTRVVGLRSFSKMSAADFAMTVAVGSVFASTISSPSPSLIIGTLSLASLFGGQWALGLLRQRISWFSKMVDNEPLLLMAGGEMIEKNLQRANVTRDDVYGKLREANAYNYDRVLAVIFETTGDVSVLHSTGSDRYIEPDFVANVIDHERLSPDQLDPNR